MGRFGMGQPVPRVEDPRLVTGRGRYVDDHLPEGCVHLHMVRSPHAHAAIRRIDVKAARRAPGVLAVYTIEDLDRAGIGPLPCTAIYDNPDGTPMAQPERPVLARDRVRFVGDPVVAIVAETKNAARDAAELVEIDYEPLPHVIETDRAMDADVPQIWPEASRNRALTWQVGDEAAVEEAMRRAARTISLRLVNNRVVPCSMETRGCLAEYDAENDRLVLLVGSQGVHNMRRLLAEKVLNIPVEKLRVVTRDVGGGFGMKIWIFPEYPIALHAARELKRPVKWIGERTEAFLADTHGRDHVTTVTVALDEDDRILALKIEAIANLGAYLSQFGPFIPGDGSGRMYTGVYDVPAALYRVHMVFTNTAPVDAYRGAGRPEAAYAVERAIDYVARVRGIDPATFRLRNMIPPEAMPYRTPLGYVYDSGDFPRLLKMALERADVAGFPERRRQARERGRLLGLGMAYYIERCAGGPDESAEVRVLPEGRVVLLIGTMSNGQGHATAYAQILSEALGVDVQAIEVIQGDTDLVATGRGTGGSRSVPVGGAATKVAAERLVEKARRLAAEILEAAEADVVFEDGRFRIVGTDRSITLFEVAERAGGLEERGSFQPPAPTFPNGAHICELSIDLATGWPTIERYTVVDDFGRVLNPLLLAGQVHGGIAQGVGQALMERTVYDPQSGQLLTASFLDYGLPRAIDLPFIDFSYVEIPCATNLLGMKGAGEAGAIGAPPAVINAIVDALAEFGVLHVDMPATPDRLFEILREKGIAAAG